MNIRINPEPLEPALDAAFMRDYLDALALVERLHRLLIDVVKDELKRLVIDDVNPVQALLLFKMGDQEVSAGELRSRGFYQGSNVSHNLRKLVELGYMHHERSKADKRSVRVSLTEKGRQLRDVVAQLFAAHAAGLTKRGILDADTLDDLTRSLKRVERYWSGQIRYIC